MLSLLTFTIIFLDKHYRNNHDLKYQCIILLKQYQAFFFIAAYFGRQGQSNQCQTPGFKFKEYTWWNGKNKTKREEAGRNRKTGGKIHQKMA